MNGTNLHPATGSAAAACTRDGPAIDDVQLRLRDRLALYRGRTNTVEEKMNRRRCSNGPFTDRYRILAPDEEHKRRAFAMASLQEGEHRQDALAVLRMSFNSSSV
jgi:hypothetical protein